MGDKKKPGRFTLQFNLKDPQQRTVSEQLEQQGRHKAQFITSAVLRYIQCPNPQEHSGEPAPIDEATLEQMLLSIMEKHPQLTAKLQNVPLKLKGAPAQAASTKEPGGDPAEYDAIKAISETLAAFRQE